MVASMPPSSLGPLLLHTPCFKLLPGFASPPHLPPISPYLQPLGWAFEWYLCPLATS